MSTVYSLRSRRLRDRVAPEIKALMGRYGVTQIELAEVLELSQSQVSRRLANKMEFTLTELDTLADYFNVSTASLFGFRDTTTPRPEGPKGRKLPRLDSNQEPTGFQLHLVRAA